MRHLLIVPIILSVIISIQSAMIAHWDFNEGTGDTLYDSSGDPKNGIIYNAIWTDGIEGTALSFDGAGDYVALGSPADLDDLPLKNFSISAWIYDEGTEPGTIFGAYYTVSGYGIGWSFRTQTSFSLGRSLIFSSSYTTTNAWVQTEYGSIQNNCWHHVVALWDSSTKRAKLYIDNFEPAYADTTAGEGNYRVDNARNKDIGQLPKIGTKYYFKGKIDEVRIYDRMLSESEIQAHYLAYMPIPNLISAVASDGTNKLSGIDDDDYVLFTFETPVSVGYFDVNDHNIDSLLPLNNNHSWLSGFNSIGSAEWNPDSTMLLVILSSTVSPPTISVGDTVGLTGRGNKLEITGSFDPSPAIENDLEPEKINISIFPNPFKMATKIALGIPNTGKVEIEIFNANGALVKSLFSGGLNPGYHSIYWDGRNAINKDVPAGLYFCKVNVGGNFNKIIPLVCIK